MKMRKIFKLREKLLKSKSIVDKCKINLLFPSEYKEISKNFVLLINNLNRKMSSDSEIESAGILFSIFIDINNNLMTNSYFNKLKELNILSSKFKITDANRNIVKLIFEDVITKSIQFISIMDSVLNKTLSIQEFEKSLKANLPEEVSKFIDSASSISKISQDFNLKNLMDPEKLKELQQKCQDINTEETKEDKEQAKEDSSEENIRNSVPLDRILQAEIDEQAAKADEDLSKLTKQVKSENSEQAPVQNIRNSVPLDRILQAEIDEQANKADEDLSKLTKQVKSENSEQAPVQNIRNSVLCSCTKQAEIDEQAKEGKEISHQV